MTSLRRLVVGLLAVAAVTCGDTNTAHDADAGADQGPRVDPNNMPSLDSGTDAADGGVTQGECQSDPDCSDGVFCNGIERCFEGSCFDSPTPQCSDPSPCTVDECDEENRRCEFVPDDSLCAPGQVCDSKAGCFTPAQCAVDEDCADGLLCNGSERCVNGQCEPGAPVECDDGIECTVDSCVEGVGECQFVADHGRCLPTQLCGLDAGCATRPPCQRNDDCDDGLFCNGTETCVDGVCEPGEAPVAPDTQDCTIDQCSESLNMVLHTPDNARCSDGEFCNGAEVCHPVDGCGPGTPPVLSDGVGCTMDACDEDLDYIEHTPDDTQCADGLFCNGAEVCHPVDDCQPGEPPDVNDGVGCTTDTCSEVNDEVVHVPDDSACDDGLFCNGAEVCDAVNDCQPGTAPDADDGVMCTTDTCDESTDGFVHMPIDAACDDGMSCNGVETCDAVAGCLAGTGIPTDDGVACTVDMCDENDGVVHVPDDSLCDDGDYCNGVETCDATAGCQAGTPPTPPDDGVACTVASCDEATDTFDQVPDDSLCDNGSFCDGVETCGASAGCQAGTPPDLDDGEICTDDVCDDVGDTIDHTPVPDGTDCGSNQICVSGSCDASVCGDGYTDSSNGEQCDDGNTSGGDGCDSNCQTESMSCDPGGSWDVSPNVSYSCLFGSLQIDLSSIDFFNGGSLTTLGYDGRRYTSSSSDFVALNMTGAATSCPSGSFTVSQTLSGDCTEVYTLTGQFTDPDTWTGEFTISYSGSSCLDCVSQGPTAVTGTRQ